MKDTLITWLALFAILITYRYVMDLRRDLKAARADVMTAWKVYEATNAQLCALQGKPVPASTAPETTEDGRPLPAAFHAAPAFGPTAIAAREELRQASSRTPTPVDIASAATEATNNGNRT